MNTHQMFEYLVANADDSQLKELRKLVLAEEDKRIKERISKGNYPLPNEKEMESFRGTSSITQGIRDYAVRTGITIGEAITVRRYWYEFYKDVEIAKEKSA